MKDPLAAILLTVIFSGMATAAEAGWLLDAERLHIAVHGRLSCQDCHSDIGEIGRHPDPVDVNRSLKDFFRLDQCAGCHEDVTDEIAAGRHAGRDANAWQRFDSCIECHDPHYEIRAIDDSAEQIASRPRKEKCSLCHEFQSKLPEFPDQDQKCLECHLAPAGDDSKAVGKIGGFCFHCHSAGNRQTGSFPLIEEVRYAQTPHQDVNCLVCHPQAAGFRHRDQVPGACGQCHYPHAEKVAHDLHAAVSCGACHLSGIEPVRDSASRHVLWRRSRRPDRISSIHQMQIAPDNASCRGCHTPGNSIGAAAMVLPAKSVICMPCHASTLSAGDAVTVLSLVFFGAGMIFIGSVWFSGGDRPAGDSHKLMQAIRTAAGNVFSRRIWNVIGALILDGFLQRRLFRVSKERWLLHALIFYPFLFRFIWGAWALAASLAWPQWPSTWAMLDKNNPLTAFLFDLSGLMVILGVGGMILRRLQMRSEKAFSGLPAADWPAYALLGGIMAAGFVLEGMRMAMTGSPDGAAYAFVGDALGRLLAGFDLTGNYGYIWYLHAILTGAFIAYLPFSRLLHMIMAPVVLAVNAAEKAGRQ